MRLSRFRSPCRTLNTYSRSRVEEPSAPIIQIQNATFYRNHPASDPDSTSNPPIFPVLSFAIPSSPCDPQCWSILGASSSGKTTFLQILRGQHLCFPPAARSFPYLTSQHIHTKDPRLRDPGRAVQYVGFTGEGMSAFSAKTRGAYLSARYESRREQTDFSLRDYLRRHTELNLSEKILSEKLHGGNVTGNDLDLVARDLRLDALLDMPVGNLSNGQTRRAIIAKAILGKPEVLLLDEPFMGLDPPTVSMLLPLLRRLAQKDSPRLVLALRPQDTLPEWITHVLFIASTSNVTFKGTKGAWLETLRARDDSFKEDNNERSSLSFAVEKKEIVESLSARGINKSSTGLKAHSSEMLRTTNNRALPSSKEPCTELGEPLVEMNGVCVKYGKRQILGDWVQDVDGRPKSGLWWKVRRGQRWGIFGPNGSGKTTLLSLICSDHPQAYSLPMKIFGRARLPISGQLGTSVFDLQNRIGQSSPEIHAFFPRKLTVRQSIENAWAETSLGKPKLTYEDTVRVDACLRWFQAELNPNFRQLIKLSDVHLNQYLASSIDWADDVCFGEISFSAQRVALLLRAIIKKPDLIILDEAFSGMDELVRDKCMLFLTWGESKVWKLLPGKSDTSQRHIESSCFEKSGRTIISGISPEQALICVSHIREEVPNDVRDWLCLPEANEGKSARFGRFDGPVSGEPHGWGEVWNS